MSDDSRKRTPLRGVPPIITERGPRHPHSERRRPSEPGTPLHVDRDLTPVTMITLVREELKSDIAAVDGKVDGVAAKVDAMGSDLNAFGRSVEGLTSEVSTTNRLIPMMLETLRDELRSRRTVEEHMTLTQADVWKHREVTTTDTEAANASATRKAKLTIVGFIFSSAGLGALIALAATRC